MKARSMLEGVGPMRGSGVILLVEEDPAMRRRIGRWLEGAGFDVMACPGPSAPWYTCVGSERGACPLVSAADLVVLNLWLGSDRALLGASARQLLGYYASTGKPIVAISHRHDNVRLDLRFVTDPVVWLDGPPDRRDLVETVSVMAR